MGIETPKVLIHSIAHWVPGHMTLTSEILFGLGYDSTNVQISLTQGGVKRDIKTLC